MELETIIILQVILELVTLVAFFVLVYNVSAIKNKIESQDDVPQFMEKAKEEEFLGNIDKAKEYLLKSKFRLTKIEGNPYLPELSSYKDQMMKLIDKELSKINN